MAKLIVTVPAQTFEYEISEQLYLDYLEAEKEGDADDFFDVWVSDTWPDKVVTVAP